MIPETPREFKPSSKEDLMFESLEKLPGDYYVIHSLKMTDFIKSSLKTREIDFVIFHPQKGILSLECKGGFPQYVNGEWKYGDWASARWFNGMARRFTLNIFKISTSKCIGIHK